MTYLVTQPHPILSATEFVAQGMTPGSVLSIAGFNQRLANRENSVAAAETARRLRLVAREVAGLLGIEMPKRARRNVNDNFRRRRAA